MRIRWDSHEARIKSLLNEYNIMDIHNIRNINFTKNIDKKLKNEKTKSYLKEKKLGANKIENKLHLK